VPRAPQILSFLNLGLLGLIVGFAPVLEGGTTHVAVMILRLLVVSAAMLNLWIWIRQGGVPHRQARVVWPMGMFLLLSFLGTLWSPYVQPSLQWVLTLCVYAGLLYLLVVSLHEWDHLYMAAAMVMLVGLIESGLALLQYTGGGVSRPAGSFFNPNFLAGYVGPLSLLAAGVVAYAPTRVGRWSPGYGCAGAAFLVLVAAMVVTGSRGAWIAWMMGACVVSSLRWGMRKTGLLCGLALTLLLLVPNPLVSRMQAEHQANPETYARWGLLMSAIQEAGDYPQGIGLGLYQYLYPRYAVPIEGTIARYGKHAQTPHNEYAQVLVEVGIIGLVVFFWGIMALGQDLLSSLRARLTRPQRGVLVGVVGGIVAILGHAWFDSNLHEPGIAVLLILLVAMGLATPFLKQHFQQPALQPLSHPRVWVGTGCIGLAITVALTLQLGGGWLAYARASESHAHDQLPQAILSFEWAVALDPGKALYHSALSAAYAHDYQLSGNLDAAKAAERELLVATRLNPLDGRLYWLLGQWYRTQASMQGQGDRLDEEPRSKLRGITELNSEDFSEAEANPVASYGESQVEWRQKAEQAFQEAITREPFRADYQVDLAQLHLALGRIQLAEERVRAAIALEPNFLPAREMLIRLLRDSGRWQEARLQSGEIVERVQRYRDWPKTPFERRFFSVGQATRPRQHDGGE
jgi:hypothetical protein